MTFVIDNENSITAFGSQQEAEGVQGESFMSHQELADLANNWPATRLVEIWNGIPGLTPVKKFTDRKSAINRIWKAIQSMNGNSAVEAPEPTNTAAPKPAKKAKQTGKGKATKSGKAKPAKTAKAGATATGARDGSKKAEVLALLKRKNGVTLAEIMNAIGWQAHSVRGFISGTLGKKMASQSSPPNARMVSGFTARSANQNPANFEAPG